ncbi:MAG TPA: hypothetical protein VN711_00750 [Candidatus Saccharimonadales bacterium]|nr:hypothetical protein [Candidatus Saccharimonadales bacterium]
MATVRDRVFDTETGFQLGPSRQYYRSGKNNEPADHISTTNDWRRIKRNIAYFMERLTRRIRG